MRDDVRMRMTVGIVVPFIVACSSSAPQNREIDQVAAQVKPVASSADKLLTDIAAFEDGFHLPTNLFAADGPLAQVVTLVAAIDGMKRIAGTGPTKVCTDAWYAAADELKGIVAGVAKTVARIKDKTESPGAGTLMTLVAEWERKSDDFDHAVCTLRKAAATCMQVFTAEKIDPGALTKLAAPAKDCK